MKIKTNKKERKSKKAKRFMAVFFTIAALCAAFLFTNQYFFKANNIIIGENDRYSYDEILQASGISPGDELYGINTSRVKTNIKEILTYTDSVKITRIPPSTLKIDITAENGMFGIMLGGDYYIISENMRVVEKIKVVGSGGIYDFKPPENIITFATHDIKKCYLGEKMEFSDNDIYDFMKEIAKFLKEEADKNTRPDMPKIRSMDITDKFRVTMNYEDRFLVKFGLFENISPKILNSYEVISRLPDYAGGLIDLTDSKAASFTFHEDILMLYGADT